jgi:hypothetical protein
LFILHPFQSFQSVWLASNSDIGCLTERPVQQLNRADTDTELDGGDDPA